MSSSLNSAESVKRAIELNQEQLVQINQLQQFLLEKLEENQQLYESVLNDEASETEETTTEDDVTSNQGLDLPLGLKVFAYPYFKDERGFTEPDNEDTIKLRELGSSTTRFLELERPNWTKSECSKLQEFILAESRAKSVAHLNESKNQLVRRLEVLESVVDSDTPIDERNKIERIKEKISELTTLTNERLMEATIPSREESENLDWLRISACMSLSFTDLDCKLKWINELHPDINKEDFTDEEIEKITKLAEEHNKNWHLIASQLSEPGKLRLPWQVCKFYQANLNSETRRTGPLSDEEKELLELLINEYTNKDTGEIAWPCVNYHMNGRTVSQLKLYWTKKNSLKKGKPWTQLEDRVLAAAVEKFGESSWHQVSQYVYGRTNRQCRERYTLRLAIPDRKGGNWTKEEDEKLMRLAPEYEFKWAQLNKEMPGRNARQISARYALINSWIESNQEEKLLQDNTINVTIKSKSHDQIREELKNQFSSEEALTRFLEVSREKLKQVFEKSHEVAILPQVEESEEASVERELVEFFAYHDAYECRKTQKVNQTANDTLLLDTLAFQLSVLIDGQPLEPENPLQHVTGSMISKNVASLVQKQISDEQESTSGLFLLPPNRVTLRGLQGLLLQEDRLRKNIIDAGLDVEESLSQFSLKDPSYRKLFTKFLSLFYWPLICSLENVPSLQVPEVSAAAAPSEMPSCSKKASTSESKKLQASELTTIRDRQNWLFKSAVQGGNKLTQVFNLFKQPSTDQASINMSADEIESALSYPAPKSNSPQKTPAANNEQSAEVTSVRKTKKRKANESGTPTSQTDSPSTVRKSTRAIKPARFFDG